MALHALCRGGDPDLEEQLCQQHIPGQYRIEIVDLQMHPVLASEHGVVAVPMVVREAPVPIR